MLVSLSAGAVGVVSYACALVLVHLLPPAEFADFAAGQMLLTVVGTAAAALVPLPLAQAVRRHPPGTDGRRAAVAFAVFLSLAVGGVAAVVTGAVALAFAGPAVALAVAASAVAVCAVVPVWGRLQGEGRFPVYAGLTVGEVGVRLVASAAAVATGAGAAGALGGYVAGAAAVLLVAAGPVLRDVGWRGDVLTQRERWGETGRIALAQVVLSTLVAADVLAAAFSPDGVVAVAGYQALSTLAKAPVYVAAGTVLVVFPVLRAAGPGAVDTLRGALLTFRRITLLAAAVLATVPVAVAAAVLPAVYLPALGALPWLALAGLGHSTTIVAATLLVAARRGRRGAVGLGTAVVLVGAGLAVGHALDGVHGLAVGAAIGALAGGLVLAVLAAPLLPPGTARTSAGDLGLAAVGLAVLVAVRPVGLLWLATACAAAAVVLRLLLRPPARRAAPQEARAAGVRPDADPAPRLRGPRDAGRQGRLAAHPRDRPAGSPRSHDADRAGPALPRRRRPGAGRGRATSTSASAPAAPALTRVLGYMLGPARRRSRRRRADVVIEDFFAPVSSIGRPALDGRAHARRGAVAQRPGEGRASSRCPCTWSSGSGSAPGTVGGRRLGRNPRPTAGDQPGARHRRDRQRRRAGGVHRTPRPGARRGLRGQAGDRPEGPRPAAGSLVAGLLGRSRGRSCSAGTGPDEQRLRSWPMGWAVGDRVALRRAGVGGRTSTN